MKNRVAIIVISSIVSFCVACTPTTGEPDLAEQGAIDEDILHLTGQWIVDLDGDVMLNPQTSGLKYDDGFLYSVSDASAHSSQMLRLHQISMQNSTVVNKYGPTSYSDAVKSSCFYSYLANKPDYEGLVPISGENKAWIFVTEDASRNEQLSAACQQQYAKSGSTFYPTLVVRLQLENESLQVTHVRPIQFPENGQVGDFPNDGIEGLTITKDNRLLLGLEKDANKQPRVFELVLNDTFWQSNDFATVQDAQLLLPTFDEGNHPINGMDVFYPSENSLGYLFAAARNDNELWIVDLAKLKPTKRIKLAFYAPSSSPSQAQEFCDENHLMNNASIEGVAVVNDEIWMVNDPWKANYHKNIVCSSDTQRYEKMAPLLFNMKIDMAWFKH